MSKKHKKVCAFLNYFDSAITGCVSISAFGLLVGSLIGITGSAVGLTICEITVVIKKSIIKKIRKKHDKIVFLAKPKLNTIKVLIWKPLIDLDNSQNEFILVNDALKEHNDMKEAIKNPKIVNSDNI